MGRQNKRTMKKYNHSRRKNNTRRKTHKKRVRKTHKKRVRTRNIMKGGSREGLISGENNSQSTSERVSAPLQTLKGKAGSLVQSVKDKFSKPVSPTAFGYGTVPDAALPSPEPIQPPASQSPETQLPAAQPPAVTSQPAQVVAPSSNPSKNKEILKHVASGLGGAAIYSNPMAVAGAAAGAAGAYGAYKLGQGAYRGIGSAKDKLKSKALIKNIEQCLKILVKYAVIGDSGKAAILQRLKKNSGYFGEDGTGPGPKITVKGGKRRKQKTMMDTQIIKNEEYKKSGDLLNIGTPEVEVEASPPPQPEPYFSLPTDVTSATTPATTATGSTSGIYI